MACCCLGAVALATALARRRKLAALFGLAFPLVITGLLLAATAVIAEHLDHYGDRARANQRALLAEVLAAPICGGTSTLAKTP